MPQWALAQDAQPGNSGAASAQANGDATTPAQDQGPIIPDSQFEAELPSLDPAMDQPLAPIDSAPPATPATPEQQQDDTAVPQEPTAAPEPEHAFPPIDQVTAGQAIAQPPSSTDSALTTPLTPLNQFDVQPTETSDQDQNEEETEIAYDTVIEGLDAVDLEAQFKDLSALEDGDGKAANASQVRARASQDEDLALRLLCSEGYYDGTASSTVVPVPNSQGRVRATLTISPGKRYLLGDIAIKADPTVPPDLIRSSLPLETGDPIVTTNVEAAEANVSLQLPQNGYPFAKVGQRDILLDETDMTGDYTLPVDIGHRSSFGGYSTEGDLAFDAEHVGVLARFKRGELYDSRKVDDLRKALVATSLFSSVSVKPVETGEYAPDGTEYVTVDVHQEAGPARTLAGQGGYGTGEGFKVQGSWTHRNLFPPEGALIVSGIAGTQEQGAGVTFRRSNAGKRDRTVQFGINASHQEYDAYSAYTAGISGSISRVSTPIWQKRWTWSYGFEALVSNERVYNFDLADTERRTYYIGALPLQLGYDRSDDLLNPTTGFRINLRTTPEASLGTGFRPYVRNMLDISGYYPVSDSIVIAGRTRLGSIYGADREDIAPSRRIYAGGGGSVRGFGYQELGPRDPNGDPIGGRSVNEFALEARYRFGNFGIVPFVDAGQVYDSQLPKFSDIRFGAGIGGRFYTNFGPFRLDVATPINRRKGESKVAVYIGIGQAF